jgi:hypothetical protein
MPDIQTTTKHFSVCSRSTARCGVLAHAAASSRLFRVASIAFVLGLIASPVTANAAPPKPDPAPVKPSPAPTPRSRTQPAPVLAPTHVQSPTTTPSSPQKTVTTNRKHRTVAAARKARARKLARATKSKLAIAAARKARARKLARATKSKPAIVPARAQPTGSQLSNAFRIVLALLIGAGVLLLALAALEPRFVRPRRLTGTFIDHRGDLAIIGVALLVGMGIAYLSALVGAV